MLRRDSLAAFFVVLVGSVFGVEARASETCTVMYELDARLVVSNTDFGKGDVSIPVPGMMLLEFQAEDETPVDGKVGILHFAVFERFTVETIVDITTAVHHFTPTCNGRRNPTWQKPSDPGFPKMCEYGGNRRPVAVGELRRDATVIEWAKCKAAPTYWAKDRKAYAEDSKSRGKGCLNELRALGNVHCDGRFACKMGSLSRGDNPVDITWNQPLIPGPPGTPGRVYISRDLARLESPKPTKGGHGSYNLVSDSPSRVWLSFVGKRDDESPHTTCR
jgi:hypothetical protein